MPAGRTGLCVHGRRGQGCDREGRALCGRERAVGGRGRSRLHMAPLARPAAAAVHATCLRSGVPASGMGPMRITAGRAGAVPSGKNRIRTMRARADAPHGRSGLEKFLDPRMKDAQARMAGRRRVKARSKIAAGMASRGIRLAGLPGHTRNDVVGLVGEMLCEDLLPRLGMGEPFHAKWRESGSSLTNGVDLVFKKGERLCAAESKHLHRSISGGGVGASSAARAVSTKVNESLTANTDSHTSAYLATLLEREFAHGAACDTRGDRKGRKDSDKRCSLLRSVIRHENYSLAVAATFDGTHDPQAADIDADISGADPRQFAEPVLALAVGVERLYDATEDMIGRFAV